MAEYQNNTANVSAPEMRKSYSHGESDEVRFQILIENQLSFAMSRPFCFS